MTPPLDHGISRRLGQFVSFCSVLAVAFGLWVLTGWMLHVQSMKSILSRQVAIKANTAACCILIGFALWILRKERPSAALGWSLAAKLAATLAGLVGLLSLLEGLYGWDLGIDHLLITAGADDIPGSIRPGLMSPITGFGFLMLGPALLLLDAKTKPGRWSAQLFPCAAAVAAVFGLLDFVLDPNTSHTYISPVTAAVLFLLAFALLLANTGRGFGALLASATYGGTLTRRLFPPAILAPFLIVGLRWRGPSAGLSSLWTDLTLAALTVVLLAGITAWTGYVVDRNDRARREGEETIARLASIVSSSDDAIISKTLEGVIMTWNRGAERLYGYTAAEAIGQSMILIVPPDLHAEFRNMLDRLRCGETVEHYETVRLRKDGQRVEVSVTLSPVKNVEGEIIGASAIVRDITERKRVQEKLRIAVLYTRSLIEASLDPLVAISRDGKVTDVNEATEKVTGVSRQQLIGSDFFSYFTDPEKARQGYRQVFADGSIRDYPLAIRGPSGAVTEVLYNASVFKNEAGEVEGVFAAARDVTERKRAEGQVRKLNQELEQRVLQRTAQLHESEQRVRRKLESILSPAGELRHLELTDLLDIPAVQALADDVYALTHIPMFILNLQGQPLVAAGWQGICTGFHRTHPEACKNCQESDRELSAGVAPGEFKLYKCKNNLWDVVTPITVGGQHVGNLFSGQFFFSDEPIDYAVFRAQAKQYGFDEKEYLAALDRVPRLSRDAVATGMAFYIKLAQLLSLLGYSAVKLARSMTETSRVNQELAASVKELEAFTYSVSHDLRAPLRHISGFSKILAEEYSANLPMAAQHHLQRIQEGTRRMGLLVDDLLNLTRIGRQDLRLQVSGLRSVLEEAIAELKPEYEDRQVQWKIGSLPYVDCDPGLMKQVFQNLISNAIKFTRPRACAVIEVGQTEDKGRAIFVRDNGVGFAMKYADKLFGVFQRLHRAEDFEGTGVGLATVQRIIQKHGGRIWAEAELDRGATFYFTLGPDTATAEAETSFVMAGAKS